MLSSVEIIDIQNTIIKMQSEVIYDLFGQLKQYMTVEELDNSQVVMKINDYCYNNKLNQLIM